MGGVPVVDESEQEVFGADAVVSEQRGFLQALFEDLLGERGERDVC